MGGTSSGRGSGTADWAPHTVASTELIDPAPVAALAALFDDELPAPGAGDVLPPLWHWAALARWPVSSELDRDGHPVRGASSFLPPLDLPRRMFAGGSVRLAGELRVGESVRRVARVESVTPKQGSSGRLAVVVVAIDLYAPDGELAVAETQTLIYREAADPAGSPSSAPAGPPVPGPAAGPVGPPLVRAGEDWRLRTDPTVLMRFSAATANAHRIHYDWPYTTGTEGYPGLVVHGPLMTLALAQAHRRAGDGRRVAALSHRAVAPLFCGDDARLRLADTEYGAAATVLTVGADRTERTHSTLDLTLH